jgi:uncharacterized protein YggU (UPF0235/DUF167 family)
MGVILHLRITPNAGRDTIDGPETRDDGTACLRIRVSAVPDKEKANAAVIALLAKTLKLPKSAFRITTGETSRFKTIAVTAMAHDVVNALHNLSE